MMGAGHISVRQVVERHQSSSLVVIFMNSVMSMPRLVWPPGQLNVFG